MGSKSVGNVAGSRAALFRAQRLGVIGRPQPGNPHEVWGVLNPGGCLARDARTYYLFPRLVAEGNYSRIGIARLTCDRDDRPSGIERVGIALEPHEQYEFSAMGGGVEDPRVTYVAAIDRYVMTYTAYVPFTPRVALAISRDLLTWHRLGTLRFAREPGIDDLNDVGNKDCVVLPEIVNDPHGEPSIALLHRPTTSVEFDECDCRVVEPPAGAEAQESIWISYARLSDVQADVHALAAVSGHHRVMEPRFAWETVKIGSGAPPIALSYGFFFVYHAVFDRAGTRNYCAGIAVLDRADPRKVLYRSPQPVLVPAESYEENGTVADVVFPTALRVSADASSVDIFYGAADRVIAAARMPLPAKLPR